MILRLHKDCMGLSHNFQKTYVETYFKKEGVDLHRLLCIVLLHSGPAKNRLPKFAEVCRNLVSSKDQLPYNSLSLLHVHMPFISYEHYKYVFVWS